MPRGRGKVTIEVSRELRDRIRELAEKHGLLYEELLWKALDAFTQNSTRGKEGAGSRHGEVGAGGGHVWCREKGKAGDLQSLLKWVDERMGLLDWWEEEGMVCFRTRVKLAKV